MLTTLRAAIHYYHKEHGPLDAVPAVTLPERGVARERWLTRSEAAAMLWACRRLGARHAHVARLILIGVYSGTRTGRILELHWLPSPAGGHVDLEAGILYRVPAGTKRTRKRAPPVRIHDRLLPHLRRWQCADAVLGLGRVITYQGRAVRKLRRSWTAAREAAGLDTAVIPHTPRHTAGTWLAQAGVTYWEAAGYLGMTAQMFEDVYGHHSPDHQDSAATARAPRKSPASHERNVIRLGDRLSK